MTTTINFGLTRADNGEALNPDRVLGALHYLGFDVDNARIEDSTTEPTIVVQHPDGIARGTAWEVSILGLCDIFAQDCIAISTDNGETGELIGPKAEAWGPFKPEYFIKY